MTGIFGHRRGYLGLFYAVAAAKTLSFLTTQILGPGTAFPVAAERILAVVLLLFILVALKFLRLQYRITVIALLLVGGAFTLWTDASLAGWTRGAVSGSGFFVLFTGVMFAGEFLNAESVIHNDRLGTSSNDHRGVPLATIGLIQFLASIGLSLGAVFVVRPLYGAHLDRPRSIFRTISGAYSTNVAISPLDAVVNLVIGLVGISYPIYVVTGLMIAAVLLLVILAVEAIENFRTRGRVGIRVFDHNTGATRYRGAVWFLLLRILVLVSVVVLIQWIVETRERITLTGATLVLVTPILVLFSRGPRLLASAVHNHPIRVEGIVEVITVLTAATIFSTVFSTTPIAARIVEHVGQVTAWSPYVGLTTIVLVTAVGACFGLHMLVFVTTIGMTLSPETLHLSPAGFAGLLIVTYIVGMNVSPLVPFTISAGDVNGGRSSWSATKALVLPWTLVALIVPAILTILFSK